MERTHVWRKFWSAVTAVLITAMFWFWSTTASGNWFLLFFAAATLMTFVALSDIRNFFEELDRRRDIERERRVDEHVARGEIIVSDSPEEFFDDLDQHEGR